jgi:hypothetical protein
METDFDKLKSELDTFRHQYNNYKKEIGNTECDKLALGFNIDNRFSGLTLNLSLDSWIGYYGQRGSHQAINCSGGKEAIKLAMVEYLNNHVYDIIEGTIEIMETDLQKHIDEEIDTLEDKLTMLKKLKQ